MCFANALAASRLCARVLFVPCRVSFRIVRGHCVELTSAASFLRGVRGVVCASMCLLSHSLFVCFVGHASGQAVWQAGEPIAVTIDYDVPSVILDTGAAFRQRSAGPEAPAMSGKHEFGFSAVGLASQQRFRAEALQRDEAEVVVHVPAPTSGFTAGALMLADASEQLLLLKRLAGEQRLREDHALTAAGVLTKHAARITRRGNLRTTAAATEPITKAEAPPTHTSMSRGKFGALVAEARAGGHVARRALENLVALASDPEVRDAIVASGAAGAAAALLKREGTDETNRALAGSLLTLLSGMPLAAEVSNGESGAGGQVEIVMPRPSRVYGLAQL